MLAEFDFTILATVNALLNSVAFVEAVQAADALADPPARLDGYSAARGLAGDRPDVRSRRRALLDERESQTVDAWFAQVEGMKSDRPGEALELIGVIEKHPVAGKSPALPRITGLGDYLDNMSLGLELLAGGVQFADAASLFRSAEEKATEQADKDVARRRLAETGRAWMTELRRMASEAPDDDAYFEVLRGLEEYGRTLDVTREQALEDLRR